MAITITIDNDTLTAGTLEDLILDESSGLQTPGTTDKGNDSNVDITDPTVGVGNTPDSNLFDGTLSGANFSASFLSFLNAATIFGFAGLKLSDVQKAYAAGVEGAVSSSDFVTVTTTEDETINDLFFSDSAGDPLNGDQVAGMQTLAGENIYLWSNGDYCIAATKNSITGDPVRVVAAFYLNEDTTDHLTAQVQMMTFEPLKHTDTNSSDDSLNFTNVLQVSAAGSLSFDFDGLPSGNFLYAAFGSEDAGLLITGADLNVKESGGPSQVGEMDGGGGKNGDPSDSVNTSQGGVGVSATIGINSQHFVDGNNADGPTGVFTLVTDFVPLQTEVPATGTNISEINYSGYLNVFGAGFFISQSESGTADFQLSLWRAGGTNGSTAETQLNYIGNQDTDSAILHDDIEVAVDTVTIMSAGGPFVWNSGNSGTPQGGITVTISGNDIIVHGMDATDTISWTSKYVAGDPGDGSFNRFSVTALNGSGGFDIGRIDLTQGVTISNAIGGDLIVQDDGPSPTSAPVTFHVDEDAMTGSGGGDGSTGIVESPPDGDGVLPAGEQDEVTFTQAQLAQTVNTGTDSPAIFSLIGSFSAGTAVTTTSGANVFSKGDQLFWRVSGGVVQGVVNAGTGSERVIFTITVNDQGTPTKTDDTFTFDLKDQLDHGNGAGELANLLLNITPSFSATDADGDPVNFGSATLIRMEVENDRPTFTAQIADGLVEFATDSTGTVTHSLNGAVGADDTNATNTSQTPSVKQYTFVNNSWTEPHTVFADLDGVLSADGTKITFYSTSVTANQNPTTAVYEITLNQTANSGAGSYTFTVLKPPPINQNSFDFTDLPSGQNLFGIIASDKDDLGKGGLLVFPSNPDLAADGTMTNVSGTINTSKGGGPVTIGNGNQAFDHTDEGAWFVYVDEPGQSAVGGLGLTQTSADDADTIDFTGTLPGINTASVEIVQASGAGTVKRPGPSMQIFAYDIDPGDVSGTAGEGLVLDPTLVGTGADKVSILEVKILDSTGKVIEYRKNVDDGATNFGTLQDSDDAGTDVSGTGGSDDPLVGIQFFLDDDGGTPDDPTDDIYSVIVSQLKANYTVLFITETAHDAALVQNVSGSFDIGGFNTFSNTDVPSQDFDFQVQINDNDNDSFTSTLAQFSVSIDGINF